MKWKWNPTDVETNLNRHQLNWNQNISGGMKWKWKPTEIKPI